MIHWIKYLIILVLLFLSEVIYFRIADKFNIIDRPNLRSSHTHITLRGGGVIFLIGAWLYAAFFGFHYLWFMTGLTVIAIVSFIDDIRNIPNIYRLVAQFVAMLLMFWDLDIVAMDSWWMVAVALVLCVGITNAYNFMDGINGITGGYSLAVLLPLIVLNFRYHYIDMSYLAVTSISVVVFCFFNFRKQAKCFAGDVGAIGIAYLLLFALGKLVLATGDLSYLLLLGVYGVDSVLTILHRIRLKENLGIAHRKHAYQIMANELKISHLLVSSIYIFIQVSVSFGILYLPINHWLYFCIAIIVLCTAYLIFMKQCYHLHAEYLKSCIK